MGRTIIQPIGPLYGEAVNGTVFGRPNGSIYIPSSNTISGEIIPSTNDYIRVFTYGWGKRIQICSNAGNVSINYFVAAVAQSQDTGSYMRVHIEDSDGDMVGGYLTKSAGLFNTTFLYVGLADDDTTITNGDTYDIVLELVSASGVPVATSKITVEGWAE